MTLTPALTKHLRDGELFSALDRIAHFAGSWTGEAFDVFNPSTGELLASLPDMGIEQAQCGDRRGRRRANPLGGKARQG